MDICAKTKNLKIRSNVPGQKKDNKLIVNLEKAKLKIIY